MSVLCHGNNIFANIDLYNIFITNMLIIVAKGEERYYSKNKHILI